MCGGWQAAIGLILITIGWPSPAARAAGDGAVSAAPCSVAAARDVLNNTLTCNFGLAPEQLRDLTKVAEAVKASPPANLSAVIANLCGVAAGTDAKNNTISCNIGPEGLVEQINDVSEKLDITDKAAVTLLRIVGEDENVPKRQVGRGTDQGRRRL